MQFKEIGMRPGEKLHEQLISADDLRIPMSLIDITRYIPLNEWDACSKKLKVEKSKRRFDTSDQNAYWLNNKQLKSWLSKIDYQ